MNGAILTFDTVSKFYGEVLGVMDVSTTIGPGVTGLLGPNGAGKTTLIKLAVGLLHPSRGRVLIDERSTWRNAGLGIVVGYATDREALPEFMTGRAFLERLLRFHGLGSSAARDAADAALEQVALADVARRRIGTYSKGMRQRLKLAQALAHRPRLLILDEPLTGLDPIGRRTVVDLVRRLGEEGRTVVVSSHVLHEVESMTARVVLIRDGRLIADGRIEDARAALLDTPYRVRIDVDDARALAKSILDHESTEGVSLRATGALVVETFDPEETLRALTRIAATERVPIRSVAVEDRDLEALFRYAVE